MNSCVLKNIITGNKQVQRGKTILLYDRKCTDFWFQSELVQNKYEKNIIVFYNVLNDTSSCCIYASLLYWISTFLDL